MASLAGPDLLAPGSPRQQLTAFWSALDTGRGVVVVDHLRAGLARAARRDVDLALDAGRLDPSDLVLYTSGATNRPRAVRRTVHSWQLSVDPFTALTGVSTKDVVWLPGSLSSTMFLFGAFHAGRVGARVVLRGEDADAITVAHAVPAQLPGLLGDVAAGRLPRLHTLVVAGDSLPQRLRQGVTAAGLHLVEYYGAAELSFVAARVGDESPPATPAEGAADGGEQGPAPLIPFPGVEVAARSGVLWSRSPYHCLGYLEHHPARSRPVGAGPRAGAGDSERPGPFRRDPDGWSTVGDLGEVADDGQFRPAVTVRGRGDAAVTVAGHTIPVEEIEAALRDLPGIDDVVVLGLPHSRLGQLVVAVVVTHRPHEQLHGLARVLPAPARPRRWLRWTRIPRTPGGKIDRAAVRSRVEHEFAAAGQPPSEGCVASRASG